MVPNECAARDSIMSARTIVLRGAHKRLRAKIRLIEAAEAQDAWDEEAAFLEHCETCDACREAAGVGTASDPPYVQVIH